jgi:hypothetical protein
VRKRADIRERSQVNGALDIEFRVGILDRHVQIRPAIEATCPHVQDLGHVVCGKARDNLCEQGEWGIWVEQDVGIELGSFENESFLHCAKTGPDDCKRGVWM